MENGDVAQLARMPLVGYKNAWQYIQTLDYGDNEGIL